MPQASSKRASRDHRTTKHSRPVGAFVLTGRHGWSRQRDSTAGPTSPSTPWSLVNRQPHHPIDSETRIQTTRPYAHLRNPSSAGTSPKPRTNRAECPVRRSLYGDRLAALFGTVGRTADRAVLRKQLVPGGSSPKSAQADTTMAGRRFGDLERQLVDVSWGGLRYRRASSVSLLATCPTSASAVFRAQGHRDLGAAQEPIPTPPGSREAQPPRGYSFSQRADPSSRRPRSKA